MRVISRAIHHTHVRVKQFALNTGILLVLDLYSMVVMCILNLSTCNNGIYKKSQREKLKAAKMHTSGNKDDFKKSISTLSKLHKIQ